MKKKLVIGGIILIVLLIIGWLFFKNRSCEFGGVSDNFSFDGGYVKFVGVRSEIRIAKFYINDNTTLDINNIDSLVIKVKVLEEDFAEVEYSSKDGDINKWLDEEAIIYEGPSYECLNDKKECTMAVFSSLKRLEFPNNLDVSIEYCIDNECQEENMKLEIK